MVHLERRTCVTQSSYTLHCVARAVDFIADEVKAGRDPSLDAIAVAGGLSKYHFHRVYRLATGETCRETVTRFRLVRAVDQLKESGVSITQAAHAVGFGSSQSFAKAVKRVLDMTASSIRMSDERLAEVIEELSLPKPVHAGGEPELRVEIASFSPFKAIARQTHGQYPELNEIYWQLFELAVEPANVQAILGQPLGDIEDPTGFHFISSLKVSTEIDNLPPGFLHAEIPGGVYAVLRHRGSYERLPETVDDLYRLALSLPELRIGDQPLLFHYLDDPEEMEESDLRTDVYMPIDGHQG